MKRIGLALLVAVMLPLAWVAAAEDEKEEFATGSPEAAFLPDSPTEAPSALGNLLPMASEAKSRPEQWTRATLAELGLTESRRLYSTEPSLSFDFSTRADQVLTAARLELIFSDKAADWDGVQGLLVTVNQEEVAHFSTAQLLKEPKRRIEVDSRLLSALNTLTLQLLMPAVEQCLAPFPAGSWSLVKSGALETRGTALPLRDNMALLPLPFFDPRYDRDVEIPFVFVEAPDSAMSRVAGLTAAYFGLHAGSRARFPVSIGELPATHAVAFAIGEQALRFGVAAAEAPTLRMIDHPGTGAAGYKLLLVQGREIKDLETAVLALFAEKTPLVGAEPRIEARSAPAPTDPYIAPRWLPPAPLVSFADIPGGDALVHRGLGGGTMAINFRLAPDLFAWPNDMIKLTVDYSQIAPSDELAPEITVELNDTYVTTLPAGRIENGVATRSERIEIHRSRLRGFNLLEFHVTWPKDHLLCGGPTEGEMQVETSILPSSQLDFQKLPHFMRMPDVSTFVDDGYPFTRFADLSETVVVLPDQPAAAELATYFSLMAHMAAVTGLAGVRVEVLAARDLNAGTAGDRDILAVGAAANNAALARWPERLPLKYHLGRLRVNLPSYVDQALQLLGGHITKWEAEKVSEILGRSPQVAVVMGTQSPFSPERSVVAVTANRTESMPAAADLVGFTVADQAGGDVLLSVKDNRWRFRIGPQYDVGELVWFTKLRWVSAKHWLVLLPSLVLAGFFLALVSRTSLRRQEARRSREG